MQPGDRKPRQLRGNAGAPGVGAVGGEEGDAGAGRKAKPHEHLLHAPDQFGGAGIGDRSARPGEGRPRRIARQRPQGLFACRRKRIERIAHYHPPACFALASVVPMLPRTLAHRNRSAELQSSSDRNSADPLARPDRELPQFVGRTSRRRNPLVSPLKISDGLPRVDPVREPASRRTQVQSCIRAATKQPAGQITQNPVQPLAQKYSASHVAQITGMTPPVSPDERGGSRSSRTRGGMRWTRSLANDERKRRGR